MEPGRATRELLGRSRRRKRSRHKLLTTRHVLTHRSWFPNWRSLNAPNKLEFIADPGTKVNYSGEGLEYLRRALEKKFKQPLDQLARKRLFQPYGMKDTRFFWDASMDESRFAVPHHDKASRWTFTRTPRRTQRTCYSRLSTTTDDSQ